MWIAQRVWLGLLLALAAWGVVRLMDELLGPERGLAHAVAGLLFLLNPYTVTFTSRGTVSLLAYAALPWLMIAAHRGLRSPRGWRWPAAFALILSLAGGGVNAGVIAWALVAPAALLLYEAAVRGREWRDVWSFGWRGGAARRSGVGVVGGARAAPGAVRRGVPLVHGAAGHDLGHVEPVGVDPAARLLGDVRGRRLWRDRVVPARGPDLPVQRGRDSRRASSCRCSRSAGCCVTRHWRYAAFFALLAVGALLVMYAGFPERHAVPPLPPVRVRARRAAPVPAHHLQDRAAARARARLPRRGGAAALAARRRWLALPALILPFLFGLPLVTGEAIDERQAYGEVPAHWRARSRTPGGDTPADRRVAVLPGELFGYYRWGDTMDPIGPALSERPLLIREIVPYADRRSSQFQEVADDLVQQDRLLPGQLERMLSLMGAGTVLVPADGRPERSGALDPARAERALSREPWAEEPARAYGSRVELTPARGWGGRPLELPELRRFPIAGADAAVRAHPASGVTVLDGDAHGIAALAAHRALPEGALRYAGDLDPGELRAELERGGTLVLTDSNRRRVVNSARLRLRYGPTLGPEDDISPDSPTFELFDRESNDRRTLALYTGLRAIESPIQPGQAIFPEHRAYAAVDGDLGTSWLADKNLDFDQRWIELRFRRPRRARGRCRLFPHAGRARGHRLCADLGERRGRADGGGWSAAGTGSS